MSGKVSSPISVVVKMLIIAAFSSAPKFLARITIMAIHGMAVCITIAPMAGNESEKPVYFINSAIIKNTKIGATSNLLKFKNKTSVPKSFRSGLKSATNIPI